jgi:hypothetical protein
MVPMRDSAIVEAARDISNRNPLPGLVFITDWQFVLTSA